MPRVTRKRLLIAFAGVTVVILLCAGAGIWAFCELAGTCRDRPWTESRIADAERRIEQDFIPAIQAHIARHGHPPDRLDQLVDAGLLEAIEPPDAGYPDWRYRSHGPENTGPAAEMEPEVAWKVFVMFGRGEHRYPGLSVTADFSADGELLRTGRHLDN